MGKKIRVNGVLYEAVTPKKAKKTSGCHGRRRMNETTYYEPKADIGLNPLPDGTGPFAYIDQGDAYKVECSLGGSLRYNEVNMWFFVDGFGPSGYYLNSGKTVSSSFDWDEDGKDVLDEFEDLCHEVSRIDLDDPDSSEKFQKIVREYGLEETGNSD